MPGLERHNWLKMKKFYLISSFVFHCFVIDRLGRKLTELPL